MRRQTNLGRRVLALVALAPLALAGCVSVGDVDVQSAGFETEVTQVQMVSALVGGKNVYIPGTVVHIGYGSLYEKVQWRDDRYVPGRDLRETQRGFFLKASYLWRM